MTTRTDALNDALEQLVGYDYVDGAGFACHGPMAAEALSSLGYDDEVGGWVEAYKSHHPPIAAPPASAQIDTGDESSWRPALGNFGRVNDWYTAFARALEEQPWADVLRTWLPRLLPGYGGGLTHGLLRTAHAVRALPADDAPSDLALAELARGLASWAGWFKALPGTPSLHGPLTVTEAIDRLPRPAEPWSPIEAGMFSRLGELTGFESAVAALGPEWDAVALSELTAAFCRVMLANPDVFPQGPVHAVTPVSAVRSLLLHLPDASVRAVYAQLWHVGAAIVCGFLPANASGGNLEVVPPTPAEIAALAVEHGDPHAIKFSEACLREHALHADPVYLLAAAHVLARTAPAWSRSRVGNRV